MPPVGFEPTISAGERAADLLLRPRGHWDRQYLLLSRAECHGGKGNKYRVTVTMGAKSKLHSNYSLFVFVTQKETPNC